MSDDQIHLSATESVQEFDDAIETPNSDLVGLGEKAVEALDAFLAHWDGKLRARPAEGAGRAGSEDADFKQYAERQLEWATSEKARVLSLLPKSGDK
jgi:hypothetical protein